MNLIYVGSSTPEDVINEFAKPGVYFDFAGHTLQNALLEGFYLYCPSLKIITNWKSAIFSKDKKKFFKRRVLKYGHNDGNYIYTGLVNIPFISLISRFVRTRKQLKEFLVKDEENVVIAYEIHTPFLLAVATLKKRIDKSCLIVPDLPEYMHGGTNPIRRFAKRIDKCIIDWCIRRFDSFALLSEPMRNKLPIDNKPWVLMEGIFQGSRPEIMPPKETCKTIMFAGNLGTHKGIKNIVDAFEMIEGEDYRLWIRGDGEYKSELLRIAEKDKRITWFPPMSREEILDYERRATIMVNGAEPDFDAALYFFPSKTMDYMASGSPTVMFHLGCMPSEYEQYVYYVDGEGSKGLRDKLVEVCEKPHEELLAFGKRAQDFIFEQKNPKSQCKKIMDLLMSL